jgi:hypothetical protein
MKFTMKMLGYTIRYLYKRTLLQPQHWNMVQLVPTDLCQSLMKAIKPSLSLLMPTTI